MARRPIKCLLVTICFTALGIILCRFALMYHQTLAAKTKVYSFYFGGQSLTIISNGSDTGMVQWSNKNPTRTSLDPTTKESNEQSKQTSHSTSKEDGLKEELISTVPSTVSALPISTETISNSANGTPNIEKKDSDTVNVEQSPTPVTDVEEHVERTVETASYGKLDLCTKGGENLVGPLAVDQSIPATEEEVTKDWTLGDRELVKKGGAFRPTKCQAVSKVAIIIPYRKRPEQLKVFVRHMHPMLMRQLLDYRIMVIEQDGDTTFNRAMLFNIGYKEALKFSNFTCFVFHDVDLIPEDDRNFYGCPNSPRHLSVAIDKFNYRLPYAGIFGGAGSFLKEDFEKINGFSNKFWGWGGEDDDLYNRISAHKFKLTRPSMTVGRYKMVRIFHKSAKADPERFNKLRDSKQRMGSDGLSNLKYHVQNVVESPLYTKVTVAVNPSEV